ncbi:MAG: STAS domain-containing protein [Actinomycetota bacterium]|nr:STAS domain-containing protein [Actinomycetota bacterium]MDQ5807078.1 STAS domain-containing protein [Actinomycetota bacterium]
MSGGGPPDRLRIELIEDSPAEATIKLHGELDLVTSQRLRDELGRLEGRRVVLDLANVEFLDSTGLVLLMEEAPKGGDVVLARDLSPPVARLFEVTKTEQLFEWEPPSSP